jgi:hypothetical protein
MDVPKISSSTQKFLSFFPMKLLLFCKHKMMIMTMAWRKREEGKKFPCKRNGKVKDEMEILFCNENENVA